MSGRTDYGDVVTEGLNVSVGGVWALVVFGLAVLLVWLLMQLAEYGGTS